MACKIKDKGLEIKIVGVFVCLGPGVAGKPCKVKLFCNLKGKFRAYPEELRGPFEEFGSI